MEKISYALGLNIGHNLSGAGIKGLNIDKFFAAVRDVLEKKQQEMTTQEAQVLLNSYFTELQAKQAEEQSKAGKEYLAANAKMPWETKSEEGEDDMAQRLEPCEQYWNKVNKRNLSSQRS